MDGSSNVLPRNDGDLSFLTDTAYFALLDHESSHRSSSKGKNKQDGLFLERLESFIEGQQKDVESFANREQRPLDEIRKLVAVPHAKYLFSMDPTLPQSSDANETSQPNANDPSIRSTLNRLSSALQKLHSAAGLDSLLLVVSPHSAPPVTAVPAGTSHSSPVPDESSEASWIGGTELGKEFWMGLKGGGVNGARAFRVKCQMRHETEFRSPDLDASTATTSSSLLPPSSAPTVRSGKVKSGDVKTELNAAVRQALRLTSGNPSAEMRWTKPTSLEESHNVQLVGWPPTIQMRNPSNNTLKDNRLLLELIRSGKMKFVKRGSPEWSTSGPTTQQVDAAKTDKAGQPGITVKPSGGGSLSVLSQSQATGSPVIIAERPDTVQRSSTASSGSVNNPSLSATPGLSGDAHDVPMSTSAIPLQSSQGTSPHVVETASGKEVRKRYAEEQNAEGEIRDELKAKRPKLDTGDDSEA